VMIGFLHHSSTCEEEVAGPLCLSVGSALPSDLLPASLPACGSAGLPGLPGLAADRSVRGRVLLLCLFAGVPTRH
jgi:hypothetical protein